MESASDEDIHVKLYYTNLAENKTRFAHAEDGGNNHSILGLAHWPKQPEK
jgi:hypothetical protein